MSCAVTKKALLDALTVLEPIAGNTNPASPGKGCVLLLLEGAGLTLTVAASDVKARLHIPAEVALGQEGRGVIVPLALTRQLVMTQGAVTLGLEITPKGLTIMGGQAQVNVAQALPWDQRGVLDYAPPTDGPSMALATDDFIRAAKATLYAASTQAFQAVFRGLLLHGHDQGLRFVASDGYRVAFADLPIPLSSPVQAIIAAGHVGDLLKLLSGQPDLALQFHAGHATIRTPRLTVTVPLMDGDFPDYKRIIPAATPITLRLSAARLRASVSRVAVLADANANNRVELLVAENRVRLMAEGDYGRGEDTEEAQHAGDPISFAVNARMLMDALAVCDGDVTLGLTSSTSPILITSEAPGVHAVLVTLRV